MVQKIFEFHQELSKKVSEIEHNLTNKSRHNINNIPPSEGVNKKITRAAIANRHQKNQ